MLVCFSPISVVLLGASAALDSWVLHYGGGEQVEEAACCLLDSQHHHQRGGAQGKDEAINNSKTPSRSYEEVTAVSPRREGRQVGAAKDHV